MNKKLLVSLVGALVVCAGVVAVFYTTRSKDQTVSTPSSTTTKSSTTTTSNSKDNSSSTGNAAAQQISIENFAFSSASVTIKVGTKVTWTNKDSTVHTVTENDSQTGPNSGNLDPGKSYSFTYNTAGTFKYHCTYHSELTGTVVVTE